jgi:hypothetical protein
MRGSIPDMARTWLSCVSVFIIACGEDSVCETAADKMDECRIEEAVAEQGFARLPLAISRDDCNGSNECFAKCVDSATCAELEAVIVRGLHSTDPNEPPAPSGLDFYDCLMACPR